MVETEDRRIARIEILAKKFRQSAIIGSEDEKRHDRVIAAEAKAMYRAKKAGLTHGRIAAIFGRDTRTVTSKIENEEKEEQATGGPLVLSVLEIRDAKDDTTSEYGKLVYFRLSNTSDRPIVAERICLEVLSRELCHYPPPIAGLIVPREYGIKLSIDNARDYMLPGRFSIRGHEIEDFEVFCTSEPSFAYNARVKVDYSESPHTSITILPAYSDHFELVFYGRRKRSPNEVASPVKPTGESLSGNIEGLLDCRRAFAAGDNTELRVFLKDTLPVDILSGVEKALNEVGVDLIHPVVQDARILSIGFKYSDAALDKMIHMDLPEIVGWQLFNLKDSKTLDEHYDKYNEKGSTTPEDDYHYGRDIWILE